MAGGLLQLVATGSKDAPLTYNPEITFFKTVYKKYSAFAIQQTVKNLGNKNFGTFNNYKIDRTGDLLKSMYFKIDIPYFDIIKVKENNTITRTFNINSLEIIYNNVVSYIYYLNNNFNIIPNYYLHLYNINSTLSIVSNIDIINNLIPEIINSYNAINNCIIFDIKESKINSIISLLSRYDNFFENVILNTITTSTDYEFNNQLITQKTYIEKLSNDVNNKFYLYYNYYNNVRNSKNYYELNEVYQYLIYQNTTDINFIIIGNYDVDVIYNYCLQNNILNYLTYQTNTILYNYNFIYNILLQIYPTIFNTFTFWKKYKLLINNKPNLDFINNTFNTFGEWASNLNISMDPFLLTLTLSLIEIYKKNYSIAENNINQLFNLMSIHSESELFIILSTFTNQYDTTTKYINFDDYNSATNTNLLNQKINEQLNNYNNLETSNAKIYAIPNIVKNLTIYPVDLMILYPYLAYKLVESLSNSLIFSNNMFLVYWRNKINNYYFLNYQQHNTNNLNNTGLYDSYDVNRNLTFYTNFNIKNLILLSDIKKYFMEMFYSTSFFGCVNLNKIEFTTLLSSINTIDITQLNINNAPISLNEANIKSYNNLTIKNIYEIIDYKLDGYTITINNWDNNSKDNTLYYIIYNTITYNAIKFVNNNFILTLTFNYLPNINTKLLLYETHSIQMPIVLFTNALIPNNNFNTINIFNKVNNIIINDEIISTDAFQLNNLIFKASTVINNYLYYFKLVSININNNIQKYLVDIQNINGNYQLISNDNLTFNKSDLISIDLEFIYIKYLDVATKDATTIINNTFIINNRNDWVYDPLKTYWLVYNNTYIILRYSNGSFIVNDVLKPVVYTVREIDNEYIPSFMNYINYYTNNNNISDLMDFTFQTPMLFLSLTGSTDISNNYIAPYLYFYNIPFLINTGYDTRLINSNLFLNNYLITIILPLNSNQFFGKTISTLYEPENLLITINHFNLVNNINQQFENIYNDPLYTSIINTLEQSKQILLNLNLDFLTNNTYYGSTSQTVLSNIKNINNYDLINYSNNDFNNSNKLFIDIYGNNNTIISNSVIQGLLLNIYNYPAVSYLPNRKISSDLIYYLSNVSIYFQEQITYISQNLDYQIVTNTNEYLESYTSLNNIINTLDENIYDYGNNYQIQLLYPLDNINFNGIYYNNNKIDISNIINNNILISNTFNTVINFDNQYTTEIIKSINNTFQNNKFNYLGPINITNNTINFTNTIDISNYLYIQLDNTKIYLLTEAYLINSNIFFYNSKLCNIIDISSNTNFNYINTIYYYKINVDLSNILIGELGNCFYNNNNIYYFNILDYNNNIELISTTQLDMFQLDYFIGTYNINTINDIINPIFSTITNQILIHINKVNIHEAYQFNYYNNDLNIINNFYINNIFNPVIKQFNIFNFIFIDSSNSIINLNSNNIYYLDLPPFKFVNNSLVAINTNEDIFINNSKNNYIKLNNYILNINDLSNNTFTGNYELSLIPLSNLNFIEYDISGIIYINQKQIIIQFNNLLTIPINSYYLINNSIIYLQNIDYQIIINDNQLNYYKTGLFLTIYLLDNNYFINYYPLFVTYEELYLKENLIGHISTVPNNIYDLSNNILYSANKIPISNITENKYVIDSIFNDNYNNIIYYDISSVYINSSLEQTIEINLYNNITNTYFIRPLIIKNKENNITYPQVNFSWINNNQIFNNSFIILSIIPTLNSTFTTLTINFPTGITSITSLQPSISIFSNSNFTINSISFNDTTGFIYNSNYKWKLLINNIYPIYFWTYFSTNNFIYSNNSITEPIYINEFNLNLFTIINGIEFIGALPNIIINTNNNLKLNNNIYYTYSNRKLVNKYYLNSLFTNNLNYNIQELNFNPSNKFIPTLLFLNKIKITNFTNSFIYLDITNINILLEASYLIIQNNNYYYTHIINSTSNGIFIDTTNFILDNNYQLNIYYSFSNIIFNNNDITVICDNDNNYKIILYKYNNFSNNELILINNCLFQVLGLNYFTKFYDLKLIYNNLSNNLLNSNGYYSLGIPNNKSSINLPININYEPLIYSLDTNNLNIGDYYINNNILVYKTTDELKFDIFNYNKNGTTITVYVNNNKFYLVNEFDNINHKDILVINNNIYIIKTITNKQIFFTNELLLNNGFYKFYYPYQPFNFSNIIIDGSGNINSNDININNYDFIEINSIFYSPLNIPVKYYNSNIFVRIATIQKTKLFFDNKLLLNKYINDVPLDNTCVIYLQGNIIDNYTIDLNNNKITNIYFYYNQPIRIGSTINFIKSLIYRDTTIIITVYNPINLVILSNVDIYLTPLILHITHDYSIYEINNYRPMNYDISNNIVGYELNNNTLNINTNLNTINTNLNTTFWVNNYQQIDNNYNTINSNLYIGSYHLLLEITIEKDFFVHLVKIIYPNNLFIYTNVIALNSDFYLDKIYKIQINFIDYSFIFDDNYFFKKTRIINKIDLVDIWYKYPIIINGVPFYKNNNFYLEILNAGIFINQDIYINENSTTIYSIIVLNNLYYLVSDIYLGNAINYIYLKNINYLQSSNPINKTFKTNLQNHNDTRILNTTITEKIVNKVLAVLDTIGDAYKYKILTLEQTEYFLNQQNNYSIGDPYLAINQNYIYNSTTYIFTNNQIPNLINNETQLYTQTDTVIDYFNNLTLFKTVPEIMCKINLLNQIEPYYILNNIKTWSSWSLLSANNVFNVSSILNFGNIIYNSITKTVYQDTSFNVFFTNDELSYLSNLLIFINTNNNEINKINIQTDLLNNILTQLKYWINDSTFWLNVIERINAYLFELNINATFNGYYLIFSDETDTTLYFSNNKRKYYLNNQYLLSNNNIISRNISNINIEITCLVNNINNYSSYGIEVNELLNTLYNYGLYYTSINTNIYKDLDENKNYKYFNSIKLFINNIWNNYKSTLNKLNMNFNNTLYLEYTVSPKYNKIVNYFGNNFTFNSTNNIDLSSNEIYIEDYLILTSYYTNQNNQYIINSDPIYPYKIYLSNDLIIPEVIYQINFYDIYYDSYLFNLQKYPLELDFYLENDINTQTNYSIIGLTKYDLVSEYLGELFLLQIINIDFNLVDYVNYKNTQLTIYKFDTQTVHVASLINIEINNILEIYKNVGLKKQINNYLIFYQNNFNFIANSTYVKYQNILYPLNIDISGNYFINTPIVLPQTITIIILFNIYFSQNLFTFIYKLNLTSPFLNYNQYINSSTNIIPINFQLNNNYIPIEIIFYDENILITQIDKQLKITNLTHYANIGETPPIEVISIITFDKYLYQTYETYTLLSNSVIWIADTSNYLLGDLASINNLTITSNIQFILNINYTENTLINKSMYIVNTWYISQYIFNPNNNNIIFDYPLLFNLDNGSNYTYYINNELISNNNIYVNNKQLIVISYSTISGGFNFIQVYKSPSQIFKSKLNMVANVTLINNIQNINNVYFIPYDQYGNTIGLYLYKIILIEPIDEINILNVSLIGDIKYQVKLLLWDTPTEIIVASNEILKKQDYKIEFNSLIIDVLSLVFYQNSYQNANFYYQENINSFYIFINENTKSFNFSNTINLAKYYMSSITTTIDLNNVFNPRNFNRSTNMKVQTSNNINNTTILEKPIFNVSKLFQSISLFLGDQLIETLTEDTFKVFYNFYITDEKRKQSDKLIKIRENSLGWQVYLPLIFWFHYNSTLALPLISLPYVDFTLKYQINNLNNIVSNNLINSTFSINPIINIEIGLDSILLDTPERLLFGSHRHEYIIERFITYPDSLIYQQKQTINLRYNNLIKDIFWIAKPIYHPNTNAYQQITYEYDTKYNYYLTVYNSFILYNKTNTITENNIMYVNDYQILKNNNQEILLNNSTRLSLINSDPLLNQYDIHYVLFVMDKYLLNINLNTQILKLKLYFINLYKNNKNIFEYSPIQTLNIQSNGIDFMPQLDYNYYSSVIPYQKFYNSPPLGYYTNTFSLNPTDKQPSGHLNFNKFDNIVLNLTNDPNVLNEPFNLSTVVKEYQILRIMSGQGSLAWLN